jgi:hypothetical protein
VTPTGFHREGTGLLTEPTWAAAKRRSVAIRHHRATLGMFALQLLGYHFVSALDSDLDAWLGTE